LKWRLILIEQMKNNGYTGIYDMVMNLAQEMLVGRSLEEFLSERRSQEAKNRIRKAKDQMMHTPNQIDDCSIFELAIRAFDIQNGWRDAYERQREYMRRDLFMGKLNPEKFSQRLQDLNKYLDYIPIEKTTGSDKTIKAYGKSLPEDEIRSIMGCAIPPEWTVNLLALVKEPWSSGKQISRNRLLQKWLERCQAKQMKEKEKIMIEIIKTQTEDAAVLAKAIPSDEDAEDMEEAVEEAAEEETTVTI
jgi:hypothetical protein